ncbi:MAG: translation elongation factor 4 [Patescibacteria group bacterium]|nr:translation elongation factor 4 [Patescibacteria group bacterium]
MSQDHIRNFCIIAHIDHGKSTLADRLLELTHAIDQRDIVKQTLDSMDLEREKGITIKLKAIRMEYKGYQLNLIDTPGHVDFTYEVFRSLAACEGAVLLVDKTQGIQAQTVSNYYKAKEAGLKIIPVINKIDMGIGDIEKTEIDMVKTFGFKKEDILKVSAKTGEGVSDMLEKIIKEVPYPQGDKNASSRALVFDSSYDEYLGVVATIRVVDGEFILNGKRKIKFLATKKISSPEEAGYFKLKRVKTNELKTGEVGYIATGFKDIHAVKVGDTVCWEDDISKPLSGYKEIKPFVFVSMYPIDTSKSNQLRDALEKLFLSDSSLSFEPESSSALGFGFRCGFLGLLHAEIIQERLEREYDLNLISTTPTVEYKVTNTRNELLYVRTPSQLPDRSSILEIQEPWIFCTIITPAAYSGSIMNLCKDRRAVLKKMEYPNEQNVVFEYELPLSELIYNFFDDLKTISSGFASLDYEFSDYQTVDVVKLDVLVHGKMVEPLSNIVLRARADEIGKSLIRKLKGVIPKQQFVVSLQATVGGKIIAREDIPALRKNVLAKMSGGHRERKDKLLDIQKKGKARMKKIGQVDIPQEAFRQILTK